MMKKFLLLSLLSVTFLYANKQHVLQVRTLQDVYNAYPLTVEAIQSRSQWCLDQANQVIKHLESLNLDTLDKEEIFDGFDDLQKFAAKEGVYELVMSVHPDEAVRNAAQQADLDAINFRNNFILSNKQLYLIIKKCSEMHGNSFTVQEKRFVNKVLQEFKRAGQGLSEKDKSRVVCLQKSIYSLLSQFVQNIASDCQMLVFKEQELQGVPQIFFDGLKRNTDGNYLVPIDYPSRINVGGFCSIATTREKFCRAFMNRGYPANDILLKEIIAQRRELALLLGYPSFAHYSTDELLMGTPEKAWEFEKNFADKAMPTIQAQFDFIKSERPADVLLNDDGSMNAWDYGYVANHIKKKHYAIDEQKFSEYFPMEKTLQALIRIYEQFFDITIKKIDAGPTWHPDVELLEIADKEGLPLGYVYLDMHPRAGKYTHAANFYGLFSILPKAGGRTPSVSALVCNFSKPTTSAPSLLSYGEVKLFFHEFGHALHIALGAAEYVMQSGAQGECDFLELPSQMLENWLEEPEILKMISSHYQTGEQLPDELIQKRLELLKLDGIDRISIDLFLGMLYLDLFDSNEVKDIVETVRKYHYLITPDWRLPEGVNLHCALSHLKFYGAAFYSYLLTRAWGADIFEQIKKEGLLNPAAGKRYVDCILSKGGSVDGITLMKNYLGREATYDAFYKKMGF